MQGQSNSQQIAEGRDDGLCFSGDAHDPRPLHGPYGRRDQDEVSLRTMVPPPPAVPSATQYCTFEGGASRYESLPTKSQSLQPLQSPRWSEEVRGGDHLGGMSESLNFWRAEKTYTPVEGVSIGGAVALPKQQSPPQPQLRSLDFESSGRGMDHGHCR